MPLLNRRKFLAGAGAAVSSTLVPAAARADSPVSYSSAYPDMLLAHIAGRLNALAASWDAERAKITTPGAIEARNRFVREKTRAMIHGYPDRTPLAGQTVASHERDGYRVENVMFQSRPNFWVTGNLYVPTRGRPPYPGVISPCGHYPLSRMEPEYQSVYIDLAKSGFVVLGYDPIGQGERRQYWNPQTGQTEVAASSTYEHSMPGQVLLLMGEDLTHYRVWDGMRAIDYLQARPEVDPQRIACAGHSGGGTLSLFISALDERVKCSVVNEGGTGHRWPVQIRPETRVGPSDVEQNIFPAAKYGIDMPDLHIAIAPRPLLALIEQYNPRFNRAAEQIRTRYVQLSVADRFQTGQANDPHAWTPQLRLATVQWLSRWLGGSSAPQQEEVVKVERPETLYCTPTGSLRYSQQGDTIFSLILKNQAQLPPHRELGREQLAQEVRSLLRVRNLSTPLQSRVQVTTSRTGYSVEKLEFVSEPGIYIPAWVFIPDQKSATYPTVLAFNDAGKQADGMEFGHYEALARQGRLVIACDVRGIGETKPPHPPASDSPGEFRQLFDVETALAYMAWFMDEDLFGMRVQDVIRSVDYAFTRPDVDRQQFQVTGKGAGALWVLYAAVLDPRISDLVCERGLLSYATLARADRYTHSAGIFIRDVLKHFDLPQLAAGLAGRKLALVAPVDHMKRPVALDTARQCYAVTAAVFLKSGAEGDFQIRESSPMRDAG